MPRRSPTTLPSISSGCSVTVPSDSSSIAFWKRIVISAGSSVAYHTALATRHSPAASTSMPSDFSTFMPGDRLGNSNNSGSPTASANPRPNTARKMIPAEPDAWARP